MKRPTASLIAFALLGASAVKGADVVPSGPPDATVDLATQAGVSMLGAEWRYGEARLVEVAFRMPGPDNKPSGPPNRTYEVEPRAGAADFDDSGWEVIAPETLSARRSTGKVCFDWYRINLTVPERLGDFDPAGSTVVFEIVVDDYAEVWVNGSLARDLGQSGGSVVAGYNVPNRLVVGRDVRPGERIQLAVFGINGPISAAPENFIWVRSARVDFYGAPPPRSATIERLDPRLDEVVPPDARLRTVVDGFTWVEGPLWDRASGCLYFSDIPGNAVRRWCGRGETILVLQPSGYTGSAPFAGREPGSNGLALDGTGRLVICQHGDRRLARLERDGRLVALADRYMGRRLNSPNDAVLDAAGAIYFTDPPFGLPGTFTDPGRELDFCGVYRLSAGGELTLLVRDLPAPNGIALSPDERTLYVSVCVPDRPVVMAYDLRGGGAESPRVLFDASPWVGSRPGLPDGMKTDRAGRLFVAGPGGVYVLSPDGTHLGTIVLGTATSNCAWGGDGSTLFITAGAAIHAVDLRTRGPGF